MKRFATFSTAAAVTGMALLAQPAAAMTCADFNDHSEEAKMAYLMGIDAGREEARRIARGDDGNALEGVAVTTDQGLENGGRENAREEARGAEDIYVQVVDSCANAPDQTVTEARKPAAADQS